VKKIKPNLDFALITGVIAGFAGVAAQRLGTVPVYETDESYILQVAYEILHHGKLALPMYRYIGGNIDNVWHSFTPVYFYSLSAFLKVFGFGVAQGRAFNLISALFCLGMVYVIGRRMFNWRAGLIASVLIVSDPTVLQRARMVRNDYLAEAFALLAFYLYEVAEQRNRSGYYVAAGLAAGAGVMCHPSILYMVLAIAVLMLIKRRLKVLTSRCLYQFGAGVLAVCSYEIVYDAIDYRNLVQQYRGDNLHFSILSLSGLWNNLLNEPIRYIRWYRIYDVTFQTVPLGLLHLFQLLIAIALIYLAARAIHAGRLGPRINEPRVRLFVVTLTVMLFVGFILHKAGYYNIHLITWFSLGVGVLLSDALEEVWRLAGRVQSQPAAARTLAAATVALLVVSYASLLARQYRRYLTEAQSVDNASSTEINGLLAGAVPAGLCPVAVMAPVLWLAFPDLDHCFATIERRMSDQVRIDDQDFALIMRPKASDHWAWGLSENRHLLAELVETPYGNFDIYYTGTKPSYLAMPGKRYYFFRQWNGHATQDQVDAARTVWSPGESDFKDAAIREGFKASLVGASGNPESFTLPLTIQLKARTIYSIRLTAASSLAGLELLVTEAGAGRQLRQIPFEEQDGEAIATDLFRTLADDRITLTIHDPGNEHAKSVKCSSAEIREVSRIENPR
jgi:4-amino-4-deoxy-L-arabinose transferase-like glycosyltransferase